MLISGTVLCHNSSNRSSGRYSPEEIGSCSNAPLCTPDYKDQPILFCYTTNKSNTLIQWNLFHWCLKEKIFPTEKQTKSYFPWLFFYYTTMLIIFINPNFNFWWLHPPHWSEVIWESFRESLIRLVHAALAKCKTKPCSSHWTFSNFLPAILLWEYSTI